jgi:phosphatidylethanolamine-binding protein (PEBP) family uncharacterized protein
MSSANASDVGKELKNHILAQAQIIGLYRRM